MNKLLYFPYISIPNSQWLIQTLLYWDEVASIVPFEYARRTNCLDSHMQLLIREELVKQIFPEQYIFRFNDFTYNFLKYVDTDPVIRSISDLGKRGLIGKNKLLIKTEKVHMAKLSDIGYELVERGLAKDKGRWFEIESYTAKSFMTYLAFLLGQETGFVPSTDTYNGFSNLLTHKENSRKATISNRVRDELRAQILNKILPVPRYIENFADILRFKHKNHDELERYRNFIESFIIDIDAVSDELKKERTNRFIEEAEDKIRYLKEQMSFFGGIKNFDFVTLCSLSSTIYPIISGIENRNTFELIGAVPGLLGAIYSTIRSNNIDELRREPLAYAALSGSRNTFFRRRAQGYEEF
ncbi:hypothetical protein [Desulfitobacterium metallireducens]|uniref:Kinase n=1 Tax=Desulfitobacterium metallireducens DSM 15288 TaxID=871968 RepID=W0EC40_9FIRM|nr:hypothetical protein [Desulfitobacterium metallireducens]AHF08440.1 hypothetical protein DESME_02965 [Desulfitobacterium metallireducens DSM 15288]